jgi:hypothetical protein
MGYLRVRSGSIWPCVLLHATHNTFIQGIFDPLTAPVGWAKYITTEFGAGLAITVALAFVYLVAHSGREGANTNWDAMLADPEVQAAIKSEEASKPVEKIDRTYMRTTDFSPMK